MPASAGAVVLPLWRNFSLCPSGSQENNIEGYGKAALFRGPFWRRPLFLYDADKPEKLQGNLMKYHLF